MAHACHRSCIWCQTLWAHSSTLPSCDRISNMWVVVQYVPAISWCQHTRECARSCRCIVYMDSALGIHGPRTSTDFGGATVANARRMMTCSRIVHDGAHLDQQANISMASQVRSLLEQATPTQLRTKAPARVSGFCAEPWGPDCKNWHCVHLQKGS